MKERLKVTLETVTPLFLGGSNPRGEPELRVASFRGVLRFWLRSLLGGVWDSDAEKVFQAESKVFGSTEHASPVILRLEHLQPHFVGYSQLTQNKLGVSYLFFSARETRSEPERKALFLQGRPFSLTCQLRPGTKEILPLEAAYASLWLLTHLGGLGTRSRRGGGNLQVKSVELNGVTTSLPALTVSAQTPRELQTEIAQGLKQLRQWAAKAFEGSLNPTFKGQPEFDVLHSDYCRIWIVDKTFNSWNEALNEFGSAMQRFRQRYDPDYNNVKAVVQGGNQLQPVKRAVFGLPMVFYYRSLGGQSATLEGSEHDRRASPLFVRVVKLANGKYLLILLQFINPLLPANEQLKLRHGRREVRGGQPDDTILEEFVTQIDKKLAPRLEVKGW